MLQENLEARDRPAVEVGEASQVDPGLRLAWWGAAVVDGTDRRIDTVNPAFARLHGYDEPASLAGRLFSDLLPPDAPGSSEEWRSDGGKAYETVHLRPDGTTVPVLVSVTPLDDRKHPGSYVVTVQDLTDLKRTEERLRRAQRMEAVGRLAGGVAHEVNNMMTIILGFSDLLTRESKAPDDRQREVEEIRKAATAGREDHHPAARLQPAAGASAHRPPAEPVVEEMVPVLRLMLPANVKVETSLAPLDVVVRADRSQLEQVLINLAFNARDAMASGGTIRVTTESRRLDEAAGQRLIGVPIPAGRYGLSPWSTPDTGWTRPRWRRCSSRSSPPSRSVGHRPRPLHRVRHREAERRLRLGRERPRGREPRFTVCLPEVSGGGAESAEESREEPMAQGRGGTVLILEDEDGVRELAARILSERGYRVVQARNGSEALAVLRDGASSPTCSSPTSSCRTWAPEELEWQVHALRPDLPILYMSGYPRDDILDRGLLRKDQPFLQKPFTSEDLASEVGRMIPRG